MVYQDMVSSMITLDPASRPTFATLLALHQSITLPDFFYSFFHPFVVALHTPSSDGSRPSPFARATTAGGTVGGGLMAEHLPLPTSFGVGPNDGREEEQLPGEGDWRIERLKRDWEGIKVWLEGEMGESQVLDHARKEAELLLQGWSW